MSSWWQQSHFFQFFPRGNKYLWYNQRESKNSKDPDNNIWESHRECDTVTLEWLTQFRDILSGEAVTVIVATVAHKSLCSIQNTSKYSGPFPLSEEVSVGYWGTRILWEKVNRVFWPWDRWGVYQGIYGDQILGLWQRKVAPNFLLLGSWRLILTCQEDAKAVLFPGKKSIPVNPSPQWDSMVKTVKFVFLHH